MTSRLKYLLNLNTVTCNWYTCLAHTCTGMHINYMMKRTSTYVVDQ
jgi:hypothetical protein